MRRLMYVPAYVVDRARGTPLCVLFNSSMVDPPGVTVPGVVCKRLLAVGLGGAKYGLPPGLSCSPDYVAAWSSSGFNAGCFSACSAAGLSSTCWNACCTSSAFQISLTVGSG